jgi:hypothetical protein
MDSLKKPDAFSSASVNECGYILSLGIEPVDRVTNAAGNGRLIFPPEARGAVVRFNAARDKAALMLGMEACDGRAR